MTKTIADYDTNRLEDILTRFSDEGSDYRFTIRSNMTFKVYKKDSETGKVLFMYSDIKTPTWTESAKDKIFENPPSGYIHSIKTIKKELLLRALEMNY